MVEVGIGSFKTVGFSAVDMQGLASSWKAGATLYGIKHILRNSANFGKKHVILTDSMTPAVAFDKGRACSHRLRRVIQQAATFSLGSGCFFFAVGGFLVSGILLMVPVVALVFAINSFETV